MGIGQPRMRAHEPAFKVMVFLHAAFGEPHFHGHTGAVLMRAQGAKVRRKLKRQHGLDAVGQIDAITLFFRRAVKLAAGRDKGRNIGNGDPNHPTAFIIRSRIRLGIDGVVKVFGIDGVNGDERDFAKVFAIFG